MRRIGLPLFPLALIFILCSCSSNFDQMSFDGGNAYASNVSRKHADANYNSRVPQHINTGEKTIIVNPRTHAFGAYDSSGNLVRAGLATSGNSYCPDIHRACRTRIGSFRIYSLGGPGCKSSIYPLPRGGAPMPYCMFFNRNQGLHGSYEVVDGNISHGCVRLEVWDAKWIRYDFARPGTKVIVYPY